MYESTTTEQTTSSATESESESKTLQDTLGQVADQAKQTFTATMGEVKQQANSRLADQKQHTADRLSGVAHALRNTSQNLQAQDETVAQYVDSFAEQIERVSGYIQNKEIGELLKDAQQLARRQPEFFVAGALAAGFLVGRFFKSSSTPTGNYQSGNHKNGSAYAQAQYKQGEYGRYGSQSGNQSTYGSQSIPQSFTPLSAAQRPNGEPFTQRQTKQSNPSPMPQNVPVMKSEKNNER